MISVQGYDPITFNWRTYLMQTNNRPADPSLFNTFVPLHGFQQGMKIEAADLMDPRLVCIATVAKVAGRLLKVKVMYVVHTFRKLFLPYLGAF